MVRGSCWTEAWLRKFPEGRQKHHFWVLAGSQGSSAEEAASPIHVTWSSKPLQERLCMTHRSSQRAGSCCEPLSREAGLGATAQGHRGSNTCHIVLGWSWVLGSSSFSLGATLLAIDSQSVPAEESDHPSSSPQPLFSCFCVWGNEEEPSTYTCHYF